MWPLVDCVICEFAWLIIKSVASGRLCGVRECMAYECVAFGRLCGL